MIVDLRLEVVKVAPRELLFHPTLAKRWAPHLLCSEPLAVRYSSSLTCQYPDACSPRATVSDLALHVVQK